MLASHSIEQVKIFTSRRFWRIPGGRDQVRLNRNSSVLASLSREWNTRYTSRLSSSFFFSFLNTEINLACLYESLMLLFPGNRLIQNTTTAGNLGFFVCLFF